MKTLARSLMALSAVAILAGLSHAADSKLKDQIVGKWEPAEQKDAKGSATIEFTKDGKLSISVKAEMLNIDIKGVYKFLDDENVEVTIEAPFGKGEKKSDKLKIKSIKDNEMTIVNAQGKEEKMKRVK